MPDQCIHRSSQHRKSIYLCRYSVQNTPSPPTNRARHIPDPSPKTLHKPIRLPESAILFFKSPVPVLAPNIVQIRSMRCCCPPRRAARRINSAYPFIPNRQVFTLLSLHACPVPVACRGWQHRVSVLGCALFSVDRRAVMCGWAGLTWTFGTRCTLCCGCFVRVAVSGWWAGNE